MNVTVNDGANASISGTSVYVGAANYDDGHACTVVFDISGEGTTFNLSSDKGSVQMNNKDLAGTSVVFTVKEGASATAANIVFSDNAVLALNSGATLDLVVGEGEGLSLDTIYHLDEIFGGAALSVGDDVAVQILDASGAVLAKSAITLDESGKQIVVRRRSGCSRDWARWHWSPRVVGVPANEDLRR